jgi:hypothetical protein
MMKKKLEIKCSLPEKLVLLTNLKEMMRINDNKSSEELFQINGITRISTTETQPTRARRVDPGSVSGPKIFISPDPGP